MRNAPSKVGPTAVRGDLYNWLLFHTSVRSDAERARPYLLRHPRKGGCNAHRRDTGRERIRKNTRRVSELAPVISLSLSLCLSCLYRACFLAHNARHADRTRETTPAVTPFLRDKYHSAHLRTRSSAISVADILMTFGHLKCSRIRSLHDLTRFNTMC